MTRFAIGDIHGGSKTFRALLARLNMPPGAVLYLLGDYIDRGPDSKGVLDIILQLMADGYDVRPVRGNHEDMLLHSITERDGRTLRYWMERWGRETLRSFGVSSPKKLPPRYLALLHQMPYIRSDEDFVFVHAGLDLSLADPVTESDPVAMLWGANGPFARDRLQGRTLITGHKVLPLQLIEMSLLTNHFYLDNGAFTNMLPDQGNLMALDLDSMELIIQPWCDDI